jgi:uncharacterized membrane protein
MIAQFKKDWLIIAIVILPFVAVAVYWSEFPESVAIHFDAKGNPNGYAGRAAGVLGPALLNLAIYALFIALPRIDPAKKNYELFAGPYHIMRLVTHLLVTLVCGVIYAYALGYRFDIATLIPYSLLVVFLILGNYMGNVRMNHFVGIRTPWTMTNETVWRRTHRLTARLWVGASICMFVVLPLVSEPMTAFLVYVAVLAVVPIVYSYIVYRQVEQSTPGSPH